jgi:hypothetical protein
MKGSRHFGSPERNVAGIWKYLGGHGDRSFGDDRRKAREVERGRPTTRDWNLVGEITRTEMKNHCWTPAWNGRSDTSEEPGP